MQNQNHHHISVIKIQNGQFSLCKRIIILESSKVNRREEEAFEEEFAAAVVDDLVSSVITEA